MRIGRVDGVERELTTDDDTFHPPTDDPWWTETVWFAWMVPERKLLGYFYPVFRPNVGVQFGGVLVVDDSAELPWEIPIFEFGWHAQIPAGLDLRDAQLDNGHAHQGHRARSRLRVRVREPRPRARPPLRGVRSQPLVTDATPPFNKGHIDQIGRVTGTMTLRGEEIAVDCFAMRDRAWGPRQDGRQPKVGYAYGTVSPEHAFLAISIDQQGEDLVSSGFLQRDGEWCRVVSGERTVERDERGRPTQITIDATDERGRALARGRHGGEPPGVHRVPEHVLLEQPRALGARRRRRVG